MTLRANPCLEKYDWAKAKFRRLDLHKNVGQKPSYTNSLSNYQALGKKVLINELMLFVVSISM